MEAAAEQELVGVAEIAEMAGVSSQAVSNWQARWTDTFPEPVVRTRMGPIWNKSDVLRWLIQTGRRRV